MYVAITRASEHMILITYENTEIDTFQNFRELSLKLHKNSSSKFKSSRADFMFIDPSPLVRFIGDCREDLILKLLLSLFSSVQKNHYHLDIPSQISNGNKIEDVSDLNAITILAYRDCLKIWNSKKASIELANLSHFV